MKIKNILNYVSLLVFIALLSSACTKEEKIVIISTNDVHASIDQFPYLATLVDGYRSQKNTEVILVDAGDRWTGNPYVDMAQQPGLPIIELMNELGYDLGTFGNHEFDFGVDLLAERTEQATFQNILANADFTDSPVKDIKPYEIVQLNNLSIAFLGLITTATNGHPAGKDESFGNVAFFDPIETAEKYRGLKDSADLFVAISHAGIEIDTLIAERVQEIDIILGGHTHVLLTDGGRRIGNVLVTQAGSRLRYAGVTTITMKKGEIKSIRNEVVRLDELKPSQHYLSRVEEIKSDPELSAPAGTILEDMNLISLLNLFSDVMRQGTGAKIALYNKGSMRLEHLDSGVVSVGDIYAAEPFKNSPVVTHMTLGELKDLIVTKFNSIGNESHTMDIYPSGMIYTIVTDENGEASDVIFNTEFRSDDNTLYAVAMSDYMDSQYVFEKRGAGAPTGVYITDLVLDYFQRCSPVDPDNYNRVEIVSFY